MGLILDSSVAIAAERRRLPVEDMLTAIRELTGPEEIALSVVSVAELEHGIWRAKEAALATRRQQFLEDLISNIPVYPINNGAGSQSGPYRCRAAGQRHPDRFPGSSHRRFSSGTRLRRDDEQHPALPVDSEPRSETCLKEQGARPGFEVSLLAKRTHIALAA